LILRSEQGPRSRQLFHALASFSAGTVVETEHAKRKKLLKFNALVSKKNQKTKKKK